MKRFISDPVGSVIIPHRQTLLSFLFTLPDNFYAHGSQSDISFCEQLAAYFVHFLLFHFAFSLNNTLEMRSLMILKEHYMWTLEVYVQISSLYL